MGSLSYELCVFYGINGLTKGKDEVGAIIFTIHVYWSFVALIFDARAHNA